MDYLLLLSSIGLGAITVFGFKLYESRHIRLLNAFTGAFLLSLTFLHLLPELYHDHGDFGGSDARGQLFIGALILTGFFVQVALDVISMGVEHGHSHSVSGRMPIGIVIGLCLHALVEAMALGDGHAHQSHGHESHTRRLLLVSIIVHNYPVAIALLGMLLQSGMKRSSALGILTLFAAMAPLGMFISSHTALANYSRELMALVIGIFMHISTTILFEASDVHRFNFAKLGAIILGTAMGVASVLFH
jgi:zinc and cadmium transporter